MSVLPQGVAERLGKDVPYGPRLYRLRTGARRNDRETTCFTVFRRTRLMNKKEYKMLHRACKRLKDGPDYRMNHYALILVNTALDFRARVEMVGKAQMHYKRQIGYKYPDLKREMERFPNTKKGNKNLAKHLWSNRMWTRAEFLRTLIREFENRGIRDRKSLKRWLRKADFERDVKGHFRTEHHSIGPAIFHWLCLRCGIDTVKPDTHILKFVSDCIGRISNAEEAVEALTCIAREQKRKARLLDSAIWHFQRDGDGKVSDLL